MPKNVKESKQPRPNLTGDNRLAPAGKLPSSMKNCNNCGQPIMQSSNSCMACGAYQSDRSLLRDGK